jgi:hypothetical protein
VGVPCYLVHTSPSSTLVEKTLDEAWTSKKPSLEHLIVFYCDAYVHVPKEHRSMLDNKAKKCIFIGYKDGIKGSKLWNIITKKTIYSQDVIFREVKDVPKQEVLPKEKELETLKFELEGDESDSTKECESEEEEEEPHTPELRESVREITQPERYTPPDFDFGFVLSITDDYPENVKEAVDS